MKKVLVGMLVFVSVDAATAWSQDAGPFDQLRRSAWRELYSSPRVEALRTQIASGRTDTEQFWREVSKEGTPLVEPSKDTDTHQLVTFLWRGASDTTRAQIVIDPFTAARPQDYLMRRLDLSDVWHLTVRMPRGARFIYRVSVNDQNGPGFFGDLNADAAVADPLNRHPWLGHSAVELPGAPPQPWIARQPNAPEGKVERHRITSASLNNARDIWVYTPPRYEPTSRPHALLVLFDGLANIQLLSVPVVLDNLIESSRIRPTVAVFVSHPGGRMEELGENPTFGHFLATELLPWMRARYNVTTAASDTIVGGQSAGGFGATYVALNHSDVFGAVLSQSAPYWASAELGRQLAERTAATDPNDDRHVREEMEDRAILEGNSLQKLFVSRARLPLRFYLNAGSFEAQFWGGPGGVNGTLESNRHMRDVLLAKGYEVHYQEFVGGHDYLSWRGLLADGLIALLGNR